MQKHVSKLLISPTYILKVEKFAKQRLLRHQYAVCWVCEVSMLSFWTVEERVNNEKYSSFLH